MVKSSPGRVDDRSNDVADQNVLHSAADDKPKEPDACKLGKKFRNRRRRAGQREEERDVRSVHADWCVDEQRKRDEHEQVDHDGACDREWFDRRARLVGRLVGWRGFIGHECLDPPIQQPIPNRFGDVLGLDGVVVFEVGDGA